MQNVRKVKLLAVILVLLLAACRGNNQQPALPTLVTTPDANPEVEVTPTEQQDDPTRGPLVRATLPPTWTPEGADLLTQAALATPTPTLTPTPRNRITAEEIADGCANFSVDQANSTDVFQIGEPVQAVWTAMPGAASYDVILVDEAGVPLVTEIIEETRYTFPADVFELSGLYAWDVLPLDAVGNQLCFSIGTIVTAEGGPLPSVVPINRLGETLTPSPTHTPVED